MVSTEEEMGIESREIAPAPAPAGTSSSSAVGWEKFLPKIELRVLLVEADDSTRQIIAALLRKCGYRVAAVSDGLKAWEVLKGKSHNIDLILTEVELPSISGYALLTLIMEHDVCKNIPVIMMSSQDSISTVYKCMLRGAADFLVKPVRKNELRNLWQHVWRKQASSSAGIGPPDESVAQQKVEDTDENNDISNHSSGSMACIQRTKEYNEKGSGAESSCTKPDSETEEVDIENDHSTPQKKTPEKLSSDINMPEQEKFHQESREVIDLIGTFDNYGKGKFGISASNSATNKFEFSSQLDLSLERYNPSGYVDQINDEHMLNHTDASAFSRYINCNQLKNHEISSEKQLSNCTPDNNHVAIIPPEPFKTTFPYPHQREESNSIPVKGSRFENTYKSITPTTYGTSNHSKSFYQMNQSHPLDCPPTNSQHFLKLMDQRNAIDQTDVKQAQKSEKSEDRGNKYPANDQSGNINLCKDNVSHHNNTGSGSRNINTISVVKGASESGNEEGCNNVHEGTSNKSTLREAALTKFRLKRKDRCFDKKVRYESRKKLAEQRPRVKGQFVRQMLNDSQPSNQSTG